MSPQDPFLNSLIEGLILLLLIFLLVRGMDILHVVWKYRKKAVNTDWENQFQVQRLVNEMIHDEKIERALKKGFLQALAEDCTTHGYHNLAEKANRAAEEI